MKNYILEQLLEILGMVPAALAKPVQEWHEDELKAKLISQALRESHEERMQMLSILGQMVRQGRLTDADKEFIMQITEAILSVENQIKKIG